MGGVRGAGRTVVRRGTDAGVGLQATGGACRSSRARDRGRDRVSRRGSRSRQAGGTGSRQAGGSGRRVLASAERRQRGLPLLLGQLAVQAGHWHVAGRELALCRGGAGWGEHVSSSTRTQRNALTHACPAPARPAPPPHIHCTAPVSFRPRPALHRTALPHTLYRTVPHRTRVLQALLEVHEHERPLHAQRVDAAPAQPPPRHQQTRRHMFVIILS